MSLSIIIPLFNKAAFVGETLQRFVPQLTDLDEVIVVDDCSTDEGPEIVRRLAHPQIRLVSAPRNDGPATARNLGAAQATGLHLLFFDADDLPQPNLLADLRTAIHAYPGECVIAYEIAVEAHGERVGTDAAHGERLPVSVHGRHAFVASALAGKPLCTASSTCVRADAFHQAGGFAKGLRYCEDPELWARLSAVHSIVHIGQALATYRDVPDSLSYGLRARPGSVDPYVSTLTALARSHGGEYARLAVSMITRNAVFSVALGGRRRELLRYLAMRQGLLPARRMAALRLLALLPRILVRWPLALRRAKARLRTDATRETATA